MPPGFVHYRFFLSGYIIEIPEAIYLSFVNPIAGISHLAGYSFHRYCDNDWDILGTNKAESRAIHELKIIGYLLYGISSVYGAIFMRHHRSFQTHFPLFSTLIRLIFIFWWLPVLWYINKWPIYQWELTFTFFFVLGLSQADMIHFFADHLWPEDGKRFIQQEKEKQWRKSYKQHTKVRSKVTHIHKNITGSEDI